MPLQTHCCPWNSVPPCWWSWSGAAQHGVWFTPVLIKCSPPLLNLIRGCENSSQVNKPSKNPADKVQRAFSMILPCSGLALWALGNTCLAQLHACRENLYFKSRKPLRFLAAWGSALLCMDMFTICYFLAHLCLLPLSILALWGQETFWFCSFCIPVSKINSTTLYDSQCLSHYLYIFPLLEWINFWKTLFIT